MKRRLPYLTLELTLELASLLNSFNDFLLQCQSHSPNPHAFPPACITLIHPQCPVALTLTPELFF